MPKRDWGQTEGSPLGPALTPPLPRRPSGSSRRGGHRHYLHGRWGNGRWGYKKIGGGGCAGEMEVGVPGRREHPHWNERDRENQSHPSGLSPNPCNVGG